MPDQAFGIFATDCLAMQHSAALLALLGLPSIPGPIAVGCPPISVIGIDGGANYAQQVVCCTGPVFPGFIDVGCVPIVL
ncbi:hypothetical protein M422DRAFT_247041 [Sphaerobolus stellatus SS14]|nr:hypothetical protein M422DRAFT_247041 [Sphaerobolus stellatus SS14]